MTEGCKGAPSTSTGASPTQNNDNENAVSVHSGESMKGGNDVRINSNVKGENTCGDMPESSNEESSKNDMSTPTENSTQEMEAVNV